MLKRRCKFCGITPNSYVDLWEIFQETQETMVYHSILSNTARLEARSCSAKDQVQKKTVAHWDRMSVKHRTSVVYRCILGLEPWLKDLCLKYGMPTYIDVAASMDSKRNEGMPAVMIIILASPRTEAPSTRKRTPTRLTCQCLLHQQHEITNTST